MKLGRLLTVPAIEHLDLLAAPVARAIETWNAQVPVEEVRVAEIDPTLADTANFCETYEIRPEDSANCVVVATRREADRLPGRHQPGQARGLEHRCLDLTAARRQRARKPSRASLNSGAWEALIPCGPPLITTSSLPAIAWAERLPLTSNLSLIHI